MLPTTDTRALDISHSGDIRVARNPQAPATLKALDTLSRSLGLPLSRVRDLAGSEPSCSADRFHTLLQRAPALAAAAERLAAMSDEELHAAVARLGDTL